MDVTGDTVSLAQKLNIFLMKATNGPTIISLLTASQMHDFRHPSKSLNACSFLMNINKAAQCPMKKHSPLEEASLQHSYASSALSLKNSYSLHQ
jgi:hypothetical protein